ncbi:protein NDNF isoform X2 [Varanus komodoensis]|uniref:protein NDNF isoform X2 n=1 Tax=Varanus komodoensis TaxID=61221 RepID=UPI001CF7C6ED|nr:protein NDNF isoform X2 [Varanus komodoensis]
MSDHWQYNSSCKGSQKKVPDMQILLSDPERCDSRELDDEIRILIGKNSASESSKSLTAFGKCSTLGYSAQIQPSMDGKKASGSLAEAKKIPTEMLEQQIISLEKQREELLAVNNQWDQQFRRMKEQYEKKVTEVKAKLESMQKIVRTLNREKLQMQQECQRLGALTTDRLAEEMRDKNTLEEENRLLKEKNILANRKKMHYECEITRLNKALMDALQNQSLSSQEPHVDVLDRNYSKEEMRTQLEVLRQQVQIYEEDFKKERSDRERLNAEKEALQRINEKLQSQLDILHSQVKDCQEKKELLETQVKQQAQALTEKQGFHHRLLVPPCLNCGKCRAHHPYTEPGLAVASCDISKQSQHQPLPDYQWYVPDWFPPDVQHKANGKATAVLNTLFKSFLFNGAFFCDR